MRELFYSIILLTGLLVFSQCKSTPSEEKKPDSQQATSWCVLLDMSGVRANPEMKKQYADNITRIMQHVQPGDNLTVALITESSANEINYWIQKDFPQFNPDTDNERKVKRREKAVAKEHLAEVGRVNKVLQDSILNSPRIASQTEILSALHVAASVFKNKDYPQKKLVILSDMEEYGPTYKFPSERLDEKRIHYVLEQERKKPQGLPRLGGVEVYVCGAHSKNSDHFFEVRNFWVQYLKECGADIQEEHYGASLNGL